MQLPGVYLINFAVHVNLVFVCYPCNFVFRPNHFPQAAINSVVVSFLVYKVQIYCCHKLLSSKF